MLSIATKVVDLETLNVNWLLSRQYFAYCDETAEVRITQFVL